jgi:copper resistance protein D
MILPLITRWVHWTICILLVSSQLFRAYILPRRKVTEERSVQEWRSEFLSCLNRLDRVTWVLALLSLVAWFMVTAWNMIGPDESMDISLFSTIALETQLGRVSIARVLILAVAGVCVFASSRLATQDENRSEKGRSVSVIAMGFLLLNLAMLALASHAAAAPGATGHWHLTIEVVHLVTASVWPGGLLFFALFLRSTMAFSSSALRALAARTTARFSGSSLAAVTVLSLTGLATSLFFMHNADDLWKTTYGQLLTTKAVLFCAMIAFGAQNHFVLKPRIDLGAREDNTGRQTSAVRTLFRNVLWELVLGSAVMLIVAMLGITEPPQHSS